MTASRRLKPDLVLLDVQLPDLDDQLPDTTGSEVARLLRKEPDPRATVLISSREAADYGGRIRRSGALGFVSKTDLSTPALEALFGGRP